MGLHVLAEGVRTTLLKEVGVSSYNRARAFSKGSGLLGEVSDTDPSMYVQIFLVTSFPCAAENPACVGEHTCLLQLKERQDADSEAARRRCSMLLR